MLSVPFLRRRPRIFFKRLGDSKSTLKAGLRNSIRRFTTVSERKVKRGHPVVQSVLKINLRQHLLTLRLLLLKCTNLKSSRSLEIRLSYLKHHRSSWQCETPRASPPSAVALLRRTGARAILAKESKLPRIQNYSISHPVQTPSIGFFLDIAPK